jgi:hypothetical protein
MQLKNLRKLLTPLNIFLGIFLILAFAIRAWRIDLTLGFYFDQGRDALVIWDLIKKGELFLIGPTTGIAGIFRGPFYYYLITPFYFLGQGNPVWPEIFLIATSVAALYLVFEIARKSGGFIAGIFALFLGTFSYEIIFASRWLSNPTPMMLISMCVLFLTYKIYEQENEPKNKVNWKWVILVFLLGSSLFHFGSSGELFYFPAVAGVIIYSAFRKKSLKAVIPGVKTIIYSFVSFFITALPLIAFNFKHDGLLAKNISTFLFGEKTFSATGTRFIYERLFELLSYFYNLLFHSPYEKEYLWLIALLLIIVYHLPELIKNEKFKIILIFLLSPLLGLLFFQGNFGNVYGYYLTGYYLIFLLFIGISLAFIFRRSVAGKIFTLSFLVFFLSHNWFWTKGMLNTEIDSEVIIVLGNQKQAIEWIYQDAAGSEFNVDVYVPPVIPHAYDYLFTWYPGSSGFNTYRSKKVDENKELLYTLYEIDPDHESRLSTWLDRQKGIGKVVKKQRFGGITVERRERIK